MTSIVFACFSPHPPLLLPTIGSEEDRAKVEKTSKDLEQLGKKLKKVNPDQIIISAPHPDWGFNVPLFFLAPDFLPAEEDPSGLNSSTRRVEESAGKPRVKRLITGPEPPFFYFKEGKETYRKLDKNKKYALIASGDLSHCLKEDGPYGFHPDGPKFDQQLMECLKKKDIKGFLRLDEDFPEAGECGLRSFSFLLGILEASKINWIPGILSYEGPFGVGYLVADFILGKR